ncbi:alpha/beta fold hydrolase [Phytohalomonas tamaricis]|uniref:alpha/beta fold hydrolase n=1 Tax=Phytohalomonas tamaricis TaxID=2081032 RepID=UPI000D0B8A27|nr:alpha/beta hydrolase [Phytohalomonas tamaricis]
MTQHDVKAGEPQEEVIEWKWQGNTLELGMTRQGQGPAVLLLPALSTISTRHELDVLQARLAERFEVITIDWPGFGDRPRPFVDWNAAVLTEFLTFLLDDVIFMPDAIIAAGHGAGLLLRYLKVNPGSASRIVLIAPTWRGPLPTAVGERKPWFGHLRYLVDRPLVGRFIYRLNISDMMIRRMTSGHVYEDGQWLSGERLRDKRRVTHAKGARHASVRFVTGGLDPFTQRAQFVAALEEANTPTLMILTQRMPPRSRAEMEMLAKLPNVETARLPHGRLSVHEEFPDDVAEAILAWWDKA